MRWVPEIGQAAPMRIKCSHCQNPIEVVEDPAPADILCPSCGSSFRLDRGNASGTHQRRYVAAPQNSPKMRTSWWRRLVLTGLVVSGGLGIYSLMPLQAWLPHERIVLALPFAPEDDAQNLIPMGETIEHPHSPRGHPGIDFQWDHSVPILASAAGKVSTIVYVREHKSWDIFVRTGVYEVRYKELEQCNPQLHEGDFVETGTLLGYPCHPTDLPDGNLKHYQIHWELASACFWKDRFCPLGYLEPEARGRIDAIWAKSNNKFKAAFPHICSREYYGRED
jgi:ribosomal protein S27E